MAHFAEINENNIVVRVLVVPNEEEHRGQDYLSNELNLGGEWIQTSYNNKIRYNFAGIGFIYDSIDDAFIAPKPCNHAEIYLNENKQWICNNKEHEINEYSSGN